MDIKSLEILEFPQIREILAGFTSFTPSRELALDLQPLSDYDRISLLLRQSAEARHLLSLQPNLSIGGVVDIREAVKVAARGSVLNPGSLLEIQHTLAALSQLRGRIGKVSEDYPLLWDIADGIAEFPHIESDIATCIAPTGELLDTASPKLSALRHQLKEATQGLMEKLESIIRSPSRRSIIQEPVITIREGRYVIPIKIESRSRMKGIVHDISNTEATAFIEPWSTVELGNTVRELKIEERHEVERILRDLSAEIGAYEADILHSIALTAELDLVLAKARYAHKVRANEPIVTTFSGMKTGNEPAGVLRLVEARHPLLGEKAVPLSVEIGQDFSILVITGPNTGGKTVTLKTIGLLSLMAQAGLPIPASEKSCIPMFDGIFADIGDEQSIAQTLSSFSWHINNIIRIIDSATDRSLVLVDELGTSTDPTEGAALARSILLHFLSRRTVTAATSHFNELKAFAHATERMQNASLDFDPDTLTPTYHLMVGIPGGSNALATAARLGLPARIIEGARKMLSHGMHELETLLASLMGEKQRIETLRSNLEKELEEATRRNKELEGESQQLRGQEQRTIQESRDKIVREAAQLHKDIRQAASELKKEKTRERLENARQALSAVREQLKGEEWQVRTGEHPAAEMLDDTIAVGDTVWLRQANLTATVVSISEETQQVEVQAGRTRIKLGLDGVEKATVPVGETRLEFTQEKPRTMRRTVPIELDLRGKRADEVEWTLDSYLNEAALANLAEARIIHGFGTGTVRQIVRDSLARHPLVKSFRSGERNEGGDGATIASL